jgi:hypothetical protein
MTEAGTLEAIPAETKHQLRRAGELLDSGKLQEALALLEGCDDESGAADALLGAAYFRLEEYAKAARSFRGSLDKGHADPELPRLLETARANDAADVRRRVPEPIHWDRAALRAGPQPGERQAEPRPSPAPATSAARALTALGVLGGLKFGQLLGLATRLLGKPESDSLWTTWYEHDFVRAMLMLAHRRERLNRRQLFGAYSVRSGVAFFRDAARSMPEWARWARTADGSWNDRVEPMAGAAGTRFGFNTDPNKTAEETGARLLSPNPRTVSRVLLSRKHGFKPVAFLNLTAAPWIQFMNHDWVSYGDVADAEPYRIPLSEDDPVRRSLHQTHMLVRPTQKDPTLGDAENVPAHINEVTSWWDGSQIYGSDQQTQDSLRTHRGGAMKLDPRTGNLPVLQDGVELTGFRRNWWVGLSMLHTLFVKEHNALCGMLAARHPRFSDQRLFDTARLINAAAMAKIHTVEWTPAILPNVALHSAMNSNWYGMLTNVLREKKQRKTVATINIADPIAGGLLGNSTDNHGVPYSLTREFLSVYRLHSLLPDEIAIYEIANPDGRSRTLPLAEMRQAGSRKLTDAISMADLFYSFGRQHPGQLVLNNFPASLQNLSIPGAGFYDLGAVDVLRDRERGVPRYNQFRRLFGLPPIARFEDLSNDVEEVKALKSVYESVEDIDLLIGNLAEAHRPTGFGFGETLFEVFILNASRRLQADRFYTEYYNEETYTEEGLAWLDEVSLKGVLLRHYPALHATGLMSVENAFEPWDVGELDPKRHPLRQFDPELRARDAKAIKQG